MKRVITAVLITSISLWANFNKSGNIVTDETTGLQWQDDLVDSSITWKEAIDRCEALLLDGYSDWRLPNKNELISIVDYSKYDPAINSVFEYIESQYYWSNSTYANDSNSGWLVLFRDGDTRYVTKDLSSYVRCVRAGQ